ncbi:hypothetical protein FYK55_28010 [Roseiconus nitratireducens]|uniref:Haloacid dehalogenase-like hydrolase n=1 Tax=Roseiconus nitratireducens TaxID=2605748 RepID=A0A5M6CRX5_9BACT|nr:haloacid dehalogenase-like hydrolase [Roseiconus nitratireducens]KAA5537957.1 hypothetical protein FYK55_28010 [Roseiconus nitratireducens]
MRYLCPSFVALLLLASAAHGADALPSWTDSAAKQAIVSFVEKVTEQDSPDFVPANERIAVFDNDGTLWPENPVPFQLAYALDTLKKATEERPELKQDPMVKAALAGDFAKLLAGKHHDGLLQIVAKTHSGMTTEAFEKEVEEWLAAAHHPRFDRRYDQLTYRPMQEVLAYLRANGFKTFIVSGGGADFMRVWSERVYGIPPEQVVGSSSRTRYELRSDGPVLIKTMDYLFVDDKEGKPVGIHHNIGRRPIACFGNSDGDKAMMEYTTIDNPHASFGMIIHHTDAEREYAYDKAPKSSGKLVEALEDAEQRGWTVVDMKRDWNQVFNDLSVTAIDVLLDPDDVMQTQSKQVNARLRAAYPAGFPLDAKHRPHITLVQRFVRTAELANVYRAVEKVFEDTDLSGMKLEAFKHYYIPDGDTGLAGIVVRPTPELSRLQQAVIEAVDPFTVESGSSSSFATTPDDLIINPALIEYVQAFVPQSSGEKFNPHVTTGVAGKSYLDKMLDEPFESFQFSPAGMAVYQLGQYGTAAKKLAEWKIEP